MIVRVLTTLDRLVIRQVLTPAILGFVTYTFLLLMQGPLILLIGAVVPFTEISVLKTSTVLANISALGAIAATIARVVGRPRDGAETSEGPIQYSPSDILFITTLFGVLFASLAVLLR